MKINTEMVILFYIHFLFYNNIVHAAHMKTEINMRETIHFTNKLSNIKNNKSNKKESPPIEEETNEYVEQKEIEIINKDNNLSRNIEMSSAAKDIERKKFLGTDKNISNKNTENSNSIISSDLSNKDKMTENEIVDNNSLKISD